MSLLDKFWKQLRNRWSKGVSNSPPPPTFRHNSPPMQGASVANYAKTTLHWSSCSSNRGQIRICILSSRFGIQAVLRIRIRDPVPFWPLDPGSGKGKKSWSGSGMNNPDHNLQSLETIFLGLQKILKFFDTDSGWKKFWFGIRNTGFEAPDQIRTFYWALDFRIRNKVSKVGINSPE